jgi:hypothetical protein
VSSAILLTEESPLQHLTKRVITLDVELLDAISARGGHLNGDVDQS